MAVSQAASSDTLPKAGPGPQEIDTPLRTVESFLHEVPLTEEGLDMLEFSIPFRSRLEDYIGPPFLPVSIPTGPANNLAPFSYQRVLRNRVRDNDLNTGRKYDIRAYTPMFVYDCLMLPGTLAMIREKV